MIESRFRKDIGVDDFQVYDEEELKKACWLATIVSLSEYEHERQFAASFAKLLFLKFPDNVEYTQVSYIILSRTGNLIATNFLKNLYENNREDELKFQNGFNTLLDLELGAKRTINQVKVLGKKYASTDFQCQLWKALNSAGNLSISAPTSAGKSFLIQNYLLEKFNNSENYLAIYIVPSRALISQVNESFRKSLSDDVKIETAFIENDENPIESIEKKTIFIITPERCLRLLQFAGQHLVQPDFIFIDEIQNIENEDSRGFLYEYVLNEISLCWPKAQIVTAGPFISNAKQLFESVFKSDSILQSTSLSPVYQLKTTIKPSSKSNNEIKFKLLLAGVNKSLDVFVPVDFDYKKLSKNKGKTTSTIVSLFGKGSQNIIYVPRTDYAEKHALNLAKDLFVSDFSLPKESSDLIDLIKEEIHPDYYLIDCLKSGVIFHHSKIPDIIRSEIEFLFSNRIIQNLVCTATLLEGVNLPAEKIFIPFPKKDTENLSLFEFGNLIGRAGRISSNLYGSIYCIEGEDENWTEDYYEHDYQKEIIPAAEKVLNIAVDEVIKVLVNEKDEFVSNRANYAVTFLKHSFLKDREKFHEYLNSKNLKSEHKLIIQSKIEESLKNITVPLSVLRSNPSIDPEQQDALYKQVLKDGIHNWVLHYNENFYGIMSKTRRASLNFNKKNMYGQLEEIFYRLDNLFDLSKEAYHKHRISRSVPQMILYAVKWLQNSSYKQLIASDINFFANHFNEAKRIDKENKDDINGKINEVIKVYSTVVTFILVKYFKLLTDILGTILTEEQKEEFSFTLSMPTMLELGTTKSLVLALISGGMPRSIAVKIFHLIPEKHHDAPLEWLKTRESLDVKPVYINYLKRQGFLKKETIK